MLMPHDRSPPPADRDALFPRIPIGLAIARHAVTAPAASR